MNVGEDFERAKIAYRIASRAPNACQQRCIKDSLLPRKRAAGIELKARIEYPCSIVRSSWIPVPVSPAAVLPKQQYYCTSGLVPSVRCPWLVAFSAAGMESETWTMLDASGRIVGSDRLRRDIFVMAGAERALLQPMDHPESELRRARPCYACLNASSYRFELDDSLEL